MSGSTRLVVESRCGGATRRGTVAVDGSPNATCRRGIGQFGGNLPGEIGQLEANSTLASLSATI